MNCLRFALLAAPTLILAFSARMLAAEFAVLTPENWDKYVPLGKEVDAIFGDLVLRNENIVAVIAQPLKTRNANMTVRGVGGCVIDLTERNIQSDQLSCYYPGGSRFQFHSPEKLRISVDGAAQAAATRTASGKTIVVEIDGEPLDAKPDEPRLRMTVRYTLGDADSLQVETIYTNPNTKPVEEELSDAIRADKTFTFGTDDAAHLFWANDEWFRQAYAVVVPGYVVKPTGTRGATLELHAAGSAKLKLGPGKQHTISRQIYPAGSLLAALGKVSPQGARKVTLAVAEPGPVAHAKLVVSRAGKPVGDGRTDAEGKLVFRLPAGNYEVVATSIDGRSGKASLDLAPATGSTEPVVSIKLPPPSYVAGTITNAAGQPIPAKISFSNRAKKEDKEAKDPDWGPDSWEFAAKNVLYTHSGAVRQPIAPGKYDVIVSYGTEHDAVFTSVDVPAGGEGKFQAVLNRSVDTRGWVSADFHNHSTPSGDNTSSQLGRVLNILCEQVEFAPCTEHNRIDSYLPHIKRLGIEKLLATCTGIELTGSPLPINHQNAFPLHHHPHTQDGGGPTTDLNPVTQVERLALWDNKSDKLVQMNHPNLPQILGDRDLDGKPDAGFERMLGFVDVIEVHPPTGIFTPPAPAANGKPAERNPIFHWMQMLNLGYRNAGVVNTDSHYNYHESGFLRNYLESPTDDPAKIDTMEMVHAAEHGHVVMTNGPFLKVELGADESKAPRFGPGDDVKLPSTYAVLDISVQCPNWFDVNRVQVFLNGRADQKLNFTRRNTPEQFSDETERFHARVPLTLKTDTHVIIATIGEGLTMGPVMGPKWGKEAPAAVSNPIFVDVDGGGFTPNKDLLDLPLPVDPTRPITPIRED